MSKLTTAGITKLITEEMYQAGQSLLEAKAYMKTIRPIVIGYQTKILAKHRFTNKGEIESNKIYAEAKGLEARHIEEVIVLDPRNSYDLTDEDFTVYLNECKIEEKAAGLVVERPEACPLLVAESLHRQARHLFVDSMKPITKIDSDMALQSKGGVEKLDQLAELSLKLVGSVRPFQNRFN